MKPGKPYEHIQLPRGDGYLIGNYIYLKNREKDGTLYLKCQNWKSKGCDARAKISNGSALVCHDAHNHDTPDSLLYRIRNRDTILNASKVEPTTQTGSRVKRAAVHDSLTSERNDTPSSFDNTMNVPSPSGLSNGNLEFDEESFMLGTNARYGGNMRDVIPTESGGFPVHNDQRSPGLTNGKLLANTRFDPLNSRPPEAMVTVNTDLHPSHGAGAPPSQTSSGAGSASTAEGPLMCGTCSVLIRNTTHNLAVHMRRHLQYRPYACVKCPYTGFDEEDVRRHISRAHDGSNTVDLNANIATAVRYTPVVEMESQVTQLIEASRSVSAGPPSSPVLPEASAGNGPPGSASVGRNGFLTKSDEISGTMESDEDDFPVSYAKCQLCSRTVPLHPEKLVQHAKGHMNFSGYCCPICDDNKSESQNSAALNSQFGNLSEFVKHMRTVHSGAQNSGQVERAIFLAEESLPRQVIELVGRAFPSDPNPGSSPGSTQVCKLKCSLCPRRVAFSLVHVEEHAAEHAGVDPYRCTYCGQPYYTSTALIIHVTSAHATAFVSLDRSMSIVDSLKIRENVVKAFPILSAESIEAVQEDVSGDSFVGLSVAIQPKAPEDGLLNDDPAKDPNSDYVKCSLCMAQISRNISLLISHAKNHLGYKPLKCGYCPMRHHSHAKMRRHSKASHPDRPLSISYNRIPGIAGQVREMKRRCFGAAIGATLNVSDIDRLLQEDEQRSTLVRDDAGSYEPPAKMPHISSSPNNNAKQPEYMAEQQSAIGAAYLLRQLVTGAGSEGHLTPSSVPSQNGPTVNTNNMHFEPPANGMGSQAIIQTSSPTPNPPSYGSYGSPQQPGVTVAKKRCAVCTITIANNPSSFENHACKHLDYKPYHCQYCAYQSYIRGKVTRHIQQVHHGLPIRINHESIPGIKDKIQSVKYQCFPFLAPLGFVDEDQVPVAPLAKGQELHCMLCQQAVTADQLGIDEHLKKHCNPQIYYCTVCDFHSEHVMLTKQHVNANHAELKVTRVICCPNEGPTARDALRDACFGPRVDDTSNDTTGGLNSSGSSAGFRMQTASATPSEVSGVVQLEGADGIPIECGIGDESGELSNFGDEEGSLMVDDEVMSNPTPIPPSTTSPGPMEVTGSPSPSQASFIVNGMLSGTPNGNPMSPSLQSDQHVTCALCNDLIVMQPGPISAHVRKHHVNYKPYQCTYCEWKSAGESEVKQHIMVNHPEYPLKVIYHPERMQLSKWQAKCFPNLPIGAGMKLPIPGRGPNNSLNPVRKLVCKLCGNNVADNPKSVGIHVKNHLNYKPYRCPDCSYMSCEQSKTRRHIEHVHGRSGDMLLVVNLDEDNIKQRITDMRAECFPNLGHVGVEEAYSISVDSLPVSTGDEDEKPKLFDCQVCHTAIPYESLNYHARSHLGKPYKCGYCQTRYVSEDKAQAHCRTAHPGAPIKIVFGGGANGAASDPEMQLLAVKRRCFPDAADESRPGSTVSMPSLGMATGAINSRLSDLITAGSPSRHRLQIEATKLVCELCDRDLASNSNSMDVHVKNHLNFKPHKCGYCEYRSCIPGKVKRHVDTVHRGKQTKIVTEPNGSGSIKLIIQHLKAVCFPNQFAVEDGGEPIPTDRTGKHALLVRLKAELDQEMRRLAVSGGSAASPSDIDDSSSMIMDPLDDSNAGISTNHGAYNFLENGDGKLTCELCNEQVSDNPSSVGLHVKVHLDYKPFGCGLCEFRTGIQSKVRLHITSIHQIEPLDDLVIYNPTPDIRSEANALRRKCFPKMGEAADSALEAAYINALTSSDAPGDDSQSQDLDDDGDAGSDGPIPADSLLGEVDESDQASGDMTCDLCWQSVPVLDDTPAGRLAAARQHAREHLNQDHYQCGVCPFVHSNSMVVKEHMGTIHAEDTDANIVFIPANPGGNVDEWREKCFGQTMEDEEGHEDMSTIDDVIDDVSSLPDTPRKEGPRYTCQLCDQAVSHYASSLYIHVKNHMDYKPYSCSACEYRSPVKSKVRRHIRNTHKNSTEPTRVCYNPKVGIEKEVALWKARCFPSSSTNPQVTNGKVPCALCQTDVSNTQLSKSVHAKNHLDAKPYHCLLCPYRSCLRGETRRHISRQHAGAPMEVKYVEGEQATTASVDEMITRCFGTVSPSAPGTATPTTYSDFNDTWGDDELEFEDGGLEVLGDYQGQYGGLPVEPAEGEGMVASEMATSAEAFNKLLLGSNESGASGSESGTSTPQNVRAHRKWYCLYCAFRASSKYAVKQHCISDHPGHPVDVADHFYLGGAGQDTQ